MDSIYVVLYREQYNHVEIIQVGPDKQTEQALK